MSFIRHLACRVSGFALDLEICGFFQSFLWVLWLEQLSSIQSLSHVQLFACSGYFKWIESQNMKAFVSGFFYLGSSISHFSHSVMFDSLQPHGLQPARLPCPSSSPGACSNSCPSNWWCYTTISSSVIPFSSCLQSFPASGSLAMSQFFTSGGQSIGVSASASLLVMYTQDWFPLGFDWFDLLAVQGALKSLLQHNNSKASILWCSAFFMVQLLHPYMTIGKTIALTRWTFVNKVMSLAFNMLSRFVIAFFPRSESLIISWLQLPSAVILEPKKIKSLTVSIVSLSICHEIMEPDAMIFIFWMLSFKPAF